MNELYNETIERNGKTYHYDPDLDIYYCRYEPMSTFDKCAWFVTILILLTTVIVLEYIK